MEAKVTMQAKWAGRRFLGLCGAALLAAAADLARAQAGTPFVPRGSVGAELRSLGSRAAAIFVGQITSVERKGGIVEVTFRVEQAVSGSVGDTFVLREWAGQWAPEQMRYVPGWRALAFVHGTSAAGLNSPVDGSLGLVPVVVQGADAPELLDIRRLAAAVLRAPGTPLPTGANGAIQLADALQLIADTGGRVTPEPVRLPLPQRGSAGQVWRTLQGGAAPAPEPVRNPRNGAPGLTAGKGGVYAAR